MCCLNYKEIIVIFVDFIDGESLKNFTHYVKFVSDSPEICKFVNVSPENTHR